MIENLFFGFLFLICIDIFLLKKISKTFSLKKVIRLSFFQNLKTFGLGLIPFPLLALWFFLCYMKLTGDCNDGGIVLLGAAVKTQILYYTIVWAPVLVLFGYINRGIKKEYLKEIGNKNSENFLTKTYMYSFILMALCFLFSIYARILYVPERNCSGENTLLAIPYYYNWNRNTPNLQNAINKEGKCFNCNYWKDALVTTKEECDKCPNREYTGKTCILKECPKDFPIKAIDVNSTKHGNRGQYCESCLHGHIYTRYPKECLKCNKVPIYDKFWDLYKCQRK